MYRKHYVIAILTSLMVLAMAALANAVGPTFSDISSGYEFKAAIDYLKDNDVVQGYPDGTYRPTSTINRAEFLKIVLKAKGVTDTATDCFPDVKGNDWYVPYVCGAHKLGYIQGYPDGLFHPEREILLAEASKITANVMGLKIDSSTDPIWYKPYVLSLESAAAIPPRIDSFEHAVTRGEMAEMVWRLKAEIEDLPSNTYENIDAKRFADGFVSESLVAFNSCSELKTHLLQASSPQEVYYELDSAPAAQTSTESGADSSKSSDQSTAGADYSSTNVQVAGVDEADIVKNDSQYIYVLKGRTIRIVKATPASSMLEVGILTFAETDENFTPTDMYVDGNQLVIVGNSYEYDPSGDIKPNQPDPESVDKLVYPIYRPNHEFAKVFIVDIADHSNPKIEREVKVEGTVNSSRKIGQSVYLVSNDYNYKYYLLNGTEPTAANLIPKITNGANSASQPVSDCTSVLYHPGDTSDNYITVTSIPLAKNSPTASKAILGTSSSVYASQENLYLTESTDTWFGFAPRGYSYDETIIHKFSLSPQEIGYLGKNKVPGHVLNQFSMDEHKGNFRVATTSGQIWSTEDPSQNNLYIFDTDLKRVGQLINIATGEQIHSVRFVGDRGYMVTFKKTDPLFVIDLKDSQAPKVLGELKIPGYSDYLHPVDENHLIGFGLDTVEPSEFEAAGRNLDFAWYQGVKIAMFDVTDVSQPKELYKEIIGDRGTTSPLLYNHKALLFAPGKGTNGQTLMALPINLAEIPESQKNPDLPGSAYGEFVGQFAYVYDVSLENGFKIRDRLTHYSDVEQKLNSEYYYLGADKNINRVVYIGDVLYTVSQAIVRGHTLKDLKTINTVELKDLGDEPLDYWY